MARRKFEPDEAFFHSPLSDDGWGGRNPKAPGVPGEGWDRLAGRGLLPAPLCRGGSIEGDQQGLAGRREARPAKCQTGPDRARARRDLGSALGLRREGGTVERTPSDSGEARTDRTADPGEVRPDVRATGTHTADRPDRPGRGTGVPVGATFVVTAAGNVYHLPSCPIIAHHSEGLKILAGGAMAGKEPCRICLATPVAEA